MEVVEDVRARKVGMGWERGWTGVEKACENDWCWGGSKLGEDE